jgi:hypothetical protein
MVVEPVAVRRRRNRRWISLPVSLAVAAAVVYATHHGGTASSGSTVGASPNAQVVHAAAVKLENNCTESNLLDCLENEPSGSSPDFQAWGPAGAVTVQQYVDTYYDLSPTDETIAARNLQNAGVQAIVDEKWTGSGKDKPTADVAVLRFASAQGAQSRALAGEGDAMAPGESDGLQVAIPGLPGYAYPHRTVDAQGFVNAQYYATVGNLLMVVFFGSTGSFDQTDFGSWALGEYLTLRTARIPATPVTMISAASTACSPLTSCLIPAPASGNALAGGWSSNSTPTIAQFVQQMYSTSYAVRATSELATQGLTGIAHSGWADADGTMVDLLLLRFKTVQGAESRAHEEIADIKGAKFSVSGPGSAAGTYSTTPDSGSRYDATVYGYVGDVEVEVHTFTVESKELGDAASAAQQQFVKLAAATTTSTVAQPAPVIPTTVPSTLSGTSSCADVIDCLIPPPSGATVRDDSTYDDSTQVTVAQFAAEKFSTESNSEQSYEAGLMTMQGVRQIVHRAWFGAAGDQADVSIIVYGNSAQAEAGAMSYQGALSESGQRFSVAGYPNAVGSVDSTVDQLGNVHAAIDVYTADFEVRMDYYSLGEFTPKDAVNWFDAQLARLPRS